MDAMATQVRRTSEMASLALRESCQPDLSPDQMATLNRGRKVLEAEALALSKLAADLSTKFIDAVDALCACQGNVIVSGMGKAGIVGRKLSASLSSTGTPSHYLHPAEAVHGDLGSLRENDIVILLSYSGETDEITRLIPTIKSTAQMLIAITADHNSTLGQKADITLVLGKHAEACTLGLAPSTSTTAMIALGDALALVTSERIGFTADNFAKFHPAGSLGQKLMNVCEVMRPIEECRVANESLSLREVIVQVSRPGRRTGAIMLTDENGTLTGIFTDSDLARLLERAEESRLDQPVSAVMARQFRTIASSCKLPEAMQLLASQKISELPVVDEFKKPLGVIDVTDVVGVLSNTTTGNNTTTDDKTKPGTTDPGATAAELASGAGDNSTEPRIIPLPTLESRWRRIPRT